ncbi:hypothetical protein [Allorhizobium borbori]|uniref:Uncharacterized protein n=1 Tax=Allorhizobium borbori TaxID=485907 RepID=A0A7W6JZY2_9HYPH|nr:hypothetical protein [Allorhizobium borbori]MBB4102648.1 hypothetical protein [Allorhizobium borbori]
MTTTNETVRAANEDKAVAPSYQPVALKAVVAAALMMKRSVAGAKPKKAA